MSLLSRPFASTASPRDLAGLEDDAGVGRDAFGEFVSRTEKKADIQDLKRLVAQLIELEPTKFARLKTIEEDLREAIEEYRRIPSYSAKKRQLQTIHRMMVGVDRAAIRRELLKLDHLNRVARSGPRAMPAAAVPKTETELVVERLLAGGDAAVFALAETFGREALQPLRQAVRHARKQLAGGLSEAEAAKGVTAALAQLAPLPS